MNCVVCGKPVPLVPYHMANTRKYCSRKCRDRALWKLNGGPCKVCGKAFHKSHSRQRYCSHKCHGRVLAKGV